MSKWKEVRRALGCRVQSEEAVELKRKQLLTNDCLFPLGDQVLYPPKIDLNPQQWDGGSFNFDLRAFVLHALNLRWDSADSSLIPSWAQAKKDECVLWPWGFFWWTRKKLGGFVSSWTPWLETWRKNHESLFTRQKQGKRKLYVSLKTKNTWIWVDNSKLLNIIGKLKVESWAPCMGISWQLFRSLGVLLSDSRQRVCSRMMHGFRRLFSS